MEIGRRHVHVVRGGDWDQDREAPIFLIEAACGWHSAMYVWLIEGLSALGKVITYDRSGLGRSSPGGACDGATRALELQALVEALQIDRPMILIGHSIAALYLRIYAHQHREKVLGMVFLDGTHELVHKLLERRTSLYERALSWVSGWARRLGVERIPVAGPSTNGPPWNTLPPETREEIARVGRRTSHVITARSELDMLAATSVQVRGCGPLGALPLLVITAGTRTEQELEHSLTAERFMEIWMLLQRDLLSLSSRATHRIIAEAGHCDLITDRKHAERVCLEIASFVNGLGPSGARNQHVRHDCSDRASNS
jgi:pimeloyl-ACP methyl ester carboxylesterase